MFKRILNITSILVPVLGVFILFFAAIESSSDSKLKEVIIRVDYAGENFFIDEEEVRDEVFNLGYIKDSTRLNEIDPNRIERMLVNDAFIRDAEVYKELNGDLHVDVGVRVPIARIFDDVGTSAYLDDQGRLMPISKKFTARCLVVNGEINMMVNQFVGHQVSDMREVLDHPDVKVIEELYTLATTLKEDEFFHSQFSQIYVNKDNEFELIPRVGDHRIFLGTTKDLNKKLNKLRYFYDEGLNKTGWNEYKTINLKYTNQVVCTKS